MPVSYRIEDPVVVISAEGAHDSSELIETWNRAERDPAYPTHPRICVDVRKSASLATRPVGDLRKTTEAFIERADAVGRCCALVARPGVQYGLMRMASTWVGMTGIDVHVTTRIEDGIDWLRERAHRAAGA